MPGTYPGNRRFLKPLLGYGIDRSHPLARGLVGCWLMNEGGGTPVNLASGVATTTAGTPAWVGGADGPATSFSGAANQFFTVADHSTLDFGGEITFVARFRTSIGSEMLYGGYQSSGPFTGVGFGIGLGTLNKLAYWSSAAGAWKSGNTAVNDGLWHTGGMSYAASAASFYLDGLPDGSPAASAPVSFAGAKAIGADTSAANRFNGSIGLVYVYNRGLSAADMASLHANPYQFIRAPTTRRFFALAAGGGSPQVATASGGFSLSGSAPPVPGLIGTGGLSLSGQSSPVPGLVPSGGFSLSGSAAPVPGPVGTGGLSLSGSSTPAPGLAGIGGLSLSGQSPVGVGAVGTGGFSLAGLATTLAIGSATASGGFSLSGSARHTPGAIGTGGFSLSGSARVGAGAIGAGGLSLSGLAVVTHPGDTSSPSCFAGGPVQGIATHFAF